MQTWPALRYLNAAMVSAAFSGSASSNTTTGECPPSSMVARFMPLAASPARCLPTGIEPVKEILLHDLGRDQVLRHIGRHAEHQIEHARRQAGIGEAFHQFDAAARRFFRGLDDDRAAGGERAGDLADRRQRREIPRREGGDHADRLLQHDLAHALLAARDDAAIGAAAFLGIPVDDVGGGEHLGARLDVDLALLLGLHLGDVVEALAHQIGGLAHDLGAVIGRGRSSRPAKPFCGGGERGVEIGFAGVRQMRQRLAGRRIDHVLALAAFAVEPFAVDVKRELGIHANLVVTRNNVGGGLALSRGAATLPRLRRRDKRRR